MFPKPHSLHINQQLMFPDFSIWCSQMTQPAYFSNWCTPNHTICLFPHLVFPNHAIWFSTDVPLNKQSVCFNACPKSKSVFFSALFSQTTQSEDFSSWYRCVRTTCFCSFQHPLCCQHTQLVKFSTCCTLNTPDVCIFQHLMYPERT